MRMPSQSLPSYLAIHAVHALLLKVLVLQMNVGWTPADFGCTLMKLMGAAFRASPY